MDLSILRRTAAEIAAAAVYELYPDIELLGGGETSSGFFYEFYFPHPLHLHVIEERMRQIVRERRPIMTLEMVPFSAAEMLRSQGHESRAEEADGEGLVEIIRIGTFHDLCPGPHLKNTAELADFKITAEVLPEKGLRITGWCHRSKGELKQFLKKLAQYTDPKLLGEKMGLWKGPVWFAKGLEKRQELIQFLKKELCVDAFEIAGPPEVDRVELHRSIGKPKVAEVAGQELWITFFNQTEAEYISCLHSIAKTLTILGFDHSAVPIGRETGYLVEDELGQKRQAVRVKRVDKSTFYLAASIEEIMALLLEKNRLMVKLEN